MRRAEEYSPQIRESASSALAANQDLQAAKGAKLPLVTGSSQSIYRTGDLAINSRATGKPSVTVSAQLPIYDWGRIDANIRGRESALEAAYARKELVNRQLAIDVSSNCLDYTKQRALLSANLEYLQKIQALVDKLNKISEIDPGREGELVQTKSRLLQARSSAETLKVRLKEIAYRLERLLGAEYVDLCDGIGPWFLPIKGKENLTKTIENHPQIKILEFDYQQLRSNIEQISASRKPLVLLRAEHAPMAASITNDYAQTLSVVVSAPLFDGNTLRSSELAALERANAATERLEQARRTLQADISERATQAENNLRRVTEFSDLLIINSQVRDNFFIQWAALGRRTLFELLAIEAEQFSILSGYYNALYDAMIANAVVAGTIGLLTGDPADYQRPNEH